VLARKVDRVIDVDGWVGVEEIDELGRGWCSE
jgi:hypothetical protein